MGGGDESVGCTADRAPLQGRGRLEVTVGEEDVTLGAAATSEKGCHGGGVLGGLVRFLFILLLFPGDVSEEGWHCHLTRSTENSHETPPLIHPRNQL